MKKSSMLIGLASMSMLFTSCDKVVGEGPVITQTRNVSNFRGITTNIQGIVNYTIDPVYKVEVQAQQNILDIIETNLAGNELIVKIKEGKRVKSHEQITVNISAPFADFVTLTGSGNFFLSGTAAAVDCNLRVSGSGSMQLQQVNISDRLTANISGSGDIKVLAGTVKNETLKISGSGKIDLGNVVAEKAITEISGSGDMRINLTQNLDVRISGSGSVYYKGTPVISTQISGSGSVKPI